MLEAIKFIAKSYKDYKSYKDRINDFLYVILALQFGYNLLFSQGHSFENKNIM